MDKHLVAIWISVEPSLYVPVSSLYRCVFPVLRKNVTLTCTYQGSAGLLMRIIIYRNRSMVLPFRGAASPTARRRYGGLSG